MLGRTRRAGSRSNCGRLRSGSAVPQWRGRSGLDNKMCVSSGWAGARLVLSGQPPPIITLCAADRTRQSSSVAAQWLLLNGCALKAAERRPALLHGCSGPGGGRPVAGQDAPARTSQDAPGRMLQQLRAFAFRPGRAAMAGTKRSRQQNVLFQRLGWRMARSFRPTGALNYIIRSRPCAATELGGCPVAAAQWLRFKSC